MPFNPATVDPKSGVPPNKGKFNPATVNAASGVAPQEAPPPGFMDAMGDAARGAVMPLTAIADAPYNAINLGKAAFGAGATAVGRPDLAPDITPAPIGPMVQNAMTNVGVPESHPQNFMQDLIKRVTQYTAAAATGSAPFGGIKTATTAAAPSVSATGGAVANAAFPDNPTAQIIGELLPSATTGGVTAMRPRAGTRAKPVELPVNPEANVKTVREAGGNPSVAMATKGWVANWIEGVGGRLPGGDYVRWKNIANSQEGMGRRTKDLASSVGDANTAEQGGRSAQLGISKFVDTFKGKWLNLDDKVQQHFSPEEGIPVTNTLKKLDDMIASGKGAEGSMEAIGANERAHLIKLRDNMRNDSQNIATPAKPGTASTVVPGADGYETVPGAPAVPAVHKPGINPGEIQFSGFQDIKRAAGIQSASGNLIGDMSTGTYKALYSAMSADIEAAAAVKGPAAMKALSNANNFYKAGRTRIDDILQPIASKAKVEDAYTAALSGSAKGASTVYALKNSLPPAEWKDFVSTVVDRMGRAKKGQQGAEGDQWSAKQFLSDWNDYSPRAREALFGGRDTPGLKDNLTTIAKATDLLTKSGAAYANPSGSAVLGANAAAGSLLMGAIGGGAYKTAAGIVAQATLNYGTQHLMTNPKFVNFVAQSTKAPVNKLPAFAARIMAMGESANDEEMKEFARQLVKPPKPQPNADPGMMGVRG